MSYMYREKIFDKLVLSVERSEDQIGTAIRYAFKEVAFLVPFPDDVCFDRFDKQLYWRVGLAPTHLPICMNW